MATKANPVTTPAIPAPSGERFNLNDPPSKDPIFIACCILIIVLSTPWVIVRLYTRLRIKPKLWWDDWSCVLGWAFMVALSGLNIYILQWGAGSDQWNISKADWKQFKTHFRQTQIIARVGMCFTKISFLLFYQRLFVPVGTHYTPIWWSIWVVFWYNVLYAVSLIITITTACVGKAAIVARGGQCVNEYAVLICASVINVSSDIMILVIPIVGIWGLQMPRQKKKSLSALFVVGGLAVLSSVARLGYQIANTPEKNPNQSIATMIVSLLNLAEQFIGVIVSCMPILPAFYRHLRSTGALSSAKTKSKSSSGNTPKKGGLTASILSFQRRGNKMIPSIGSSSKRSKNSKIKDPFPIYSTTDDKMTTRGYEELAELERGPTPREIGVEWERNERERERTQPRLSRNDGHDTSKSIVKDTEVDIVYDRR